MFTPANTASLICLRWVRMAKKAEKARIRTSSAGNNRLRQCARNPEKKALPLLELVIVLFVTVLGFSVIGFNLSRVMRPTKVKAAARDIASALRYARGQALISHQETTVTIDLADTPTRSVIGIRFIPFLRL